MKCSLSTTNCSEGGLRPWCRLPRSLDRYGTCVHCARAREGFLSALAAHFIDPADKAQLPVFILCRGTVERPPWNED